MHPLTIEDILSQETREKIETYEQLGYYFVAFRALDETYFKYSEESSSTSSPSTSKTSSREDGSGSTLTKVTSWLGNGKGTDIDTGHLENGKGKSSPDVEEKSLAASEESRSGSAKRKKGIVEIVEGHKEGVEGAGVGAVNVYLVVFGDGIISVSSASLPPLRFTYFIRGRIRSSTSKISQITRTESRTVLTTLESLSIFHLVSESTMDW